MLGAAPAVAFPREPAVEIYTSASSGSPCGQARRAGPRCSGSPDPPLTWLTWLTWGWLAHLTPLLTWLTWLTWVWLAHLTPLLTWLTWLTWGWLAHLTPLLTWLTWFTWLTWLTWGSRGAHVAHVGWLAHLTPLLTWLTWLTWARRLLLRHTTRLEKLLEKLPVPALPNGRFTSRSKMSTTSGSFVATPFRPATEHDTSPPSLHYAPGTPTLVSGHSKRYTGTARPESPKVR